MNEKLLSVIILTYKHGDFLYECLESVFNQDYSKIELIVAEDGAKDFDTQKVRSYIEKNARANIVNKIVVVNQTNVGTVVNINNAINLSNGDYIKIIAGDDSYPTNTVFSEQVQCLENNRENYLVVGNIVECDGMMNPVVDKKFIPGKKESLLKGQKKKLLKYFCKKDPSIFATQSICFRKSFFEKYGLFDQDFKLVEDLPLGVKIITCGISFEYLNKECVNHRGSVGISTSSNAFDKKKISYYSDLKLYYEKCLMPIKKEVGRLFVKMRYDICKFRIEYTLKQKSKTSLILKYFFPLCYYILTKPKRVSFYTKKSRKK